MESYQTILVVDDEKTNVEFIVANLEQEYKIKTAPNGKVALKILEKFDIDLILLDIHMPIMDGYEVAKQLQENPKTQNIPIIFLTADNDTESLIKGFDYGAKDYIIKPFNQKELIVRVRNHINGYLNEKILKVQKEEFESLFRQSRDGIAIMDLTSKFLDFNEAYLDMLGYTQEELRKKTCIDLSIPEEKENSIKALEIALETGYLKNLEKTCITKDGKRIVVNMSATLLPDHKRFLAVTKDVTSLKMMEEQSRLASMGEMIGNIAHQWRQPLSVISSASTGMLMQKEYGLLTDERFTENCEAINKNAQYLSKTIDDFRNFIKGDRNKVVFDLNNEITSFLHLVEGSIKNHHINIILNLQNDIEILGYENELTQCFINIFNNAKDTLKDKSEDERAIFISTITEDDKAIITIKDNAGGIPQDIMPKIFEPYFTTKHQSQGTGLGLSMSYKLIVDGMNGTIIASNTEFEYNGKTYVGAEFTITLPCN